MTLPAVQCSHWRDCGVAGGGCCGLDLHGGRPSVGTCLRACDRWEGPDRGLGDMIHRAAVKLAPAKAAGCAGCDHRRHGLNDLVPFAAGALG